MSREADIWACNNPGCNYVWCDRHGHGKPPHRNCSITHPSQNTLVDLRDLASKAPEGTIRSEIEEIATVAQADPALLAKAAHWVTAGKRWTAAGWPVRTMADAETCHVICKACPSDEYNEKSDSCRVCGCKLKVSWLPLKSKPRMATEDCPKGHWPKT